MIGISDFIPPIVHKVRRRFAARAEAEEQEIFPNYASAAFCARGWNDEELVEWIVRDAVLFRDNTGAVTPLELRAISALGWVLCQAGLEAGDKLRVIEFGGSAGFNYFAAKRLFAPRSFQWAVVETDAMIARASAALNDGKLAFYAGVSEAVAAVRRPQLAFSCGALQYHPQPLVALEQLVDLRAPYLVLYRTALTDRAATFCAVQRAPLSNHLHCPLPDGVADFEMRHPVSFVSRAAVVDLLRREYEIIAEMDEGILHPLRSEPVHGYAYYCRRRG